MDDKEPVQDVKGWTEQISAAVTDGAWFAGQKADFYNVRMAKWDGQSADGRKHADDLGKKAFPWEGASDARIRLVDFICNRNVTLLMQAFFRARVQMQPVESSDAARKARAQQVLRWMLFQHCADDLRREIELCLNIRANYGLAVMGIFWRTTTRTQLVPMSLEMLAAKAAETGDAGLDALVGAILDPMYEDVAIEGLKRFAEAAGTAANVRALREGKEIEIPEPYIFESRPEWCALEPWHDVVFPVNTFDLQRAPWVARRELITVEELEERKLTEGYPESFIEQAAQKKGNTLFPMQDQANASRNPGSFWLDNKDMVELWHVYAKEEDEKTHATRVMVRVICADVDDFAKEEVLDYDHGQYPFVEMPRERVTRCLLDSRGVPEIVESLQLEIKAQRDYRADRASIAILPPLRVPANRGKMEIALGPSVQISERRPNEIGWMQPPPFDQGTIEVERAVRRDCNEYFGIPGEGVDPNWVVMCQQGEVDKWLRDGRQALAMTFQLMQQYMSPMEVLRVTGGREVPFAASREEIQGKFDTTVEFDVRDLDTDSLGVKLDYISKVVVPLDVRGILDRSALVKFVMAAVDPTMAETLVRDEQSATQSEIEEEQSAFAKIAAGTEPQLPGKGVNAGLRAQVLQQIIQANPAVTKRYAEDEIFKAMIDERLKALTFQVEQQQNASIGRIGAQPALGVELGGGMAQ